MNYNKFFRVLMALLVVCCLLVNFSPIRAHAVAASIATVGVAAAIVVGSILIGIGLLPDADTSVFTSTVDSIISSLNLGETIQLVTWVTSGYKKYAVPDTLIESIRSFVFNQALAYRVSPVDCVAVGAGESIRVGTNAVYTVTEYCEVFCAQGIFSGEGNFLFLSEFPFSVNGDEAIPYGDLYYQFDRGRKTDVWDSEGYYKLPFAPYGAYDAENLANACYASYCGPEIGVESGFVAGTIADPSSDLKSGYADWSSQSIPLYLWADGNYSEDPETDDSESIPYLPVGIGKDYEETLTYTQSQVQAGESTYEDTSADVGGATSSISQTWLGQKLDSIVSSISGFFSDVITTIKAIPDAFTTWFEDILMGLETLGQTILDGIQAIFVPSADFVTAKVEALRARFDFINVFMDFIDSFKGQFSGGTPPVIYVHLENAEGSYNYGGTVKFLDMSWYSRYKSTGDALISGFLWALFGWRMYLKLPGIINGVSGGVGSMSSRYKKDGD